MLTINPTLTTSVCPIKDISWRTKLPYQGCYESELKPHANIMRNAVICTSGGVKLASALRSTGMRGAVIEKTLEIEANVGFARKNKIIFLQVWRDCHGLCLLMYKQKVKQE